MQKGVGEKYTSANVILKEKDEMGALLLGDCNSAVDNHIIKPYKIQTILTFGNDGAPEKQDKELIYKLYNVLDNKSQKIGELLDEVFEEVQRARKIGGVLLHCYTGISRSSSFAIAYLMRKRQMSYDDAKKFVKKQRSLIQPNDNFHRQLQNYEKILRKRREEEEERLTKERAQKQTECPLPNQSNNYSSMSSISKRTVRGVKGAVKSAHRSISPKHNSLQKMQQTTEKLEKSQIKEHQRLMKQEQSTQKSRQAKQKDVKGVYSAKTKVK